MVCSEVIKIATKKLHAEAEAVLIPQIKGVTNFEDYKRLLALFFGFFAPAEERISHYVRPDILPDINTRRKSASIINSFSSSTFTTVAAPGDLPAINNVLQAFGAMYVLEGSTLGGKIICRMLQTNTSLQLSKDDLNFFDVYGEETFEKWNSFKAVMDNYITNESDINFAAAAAGETFSKMKAWMQNTNL